MQDIKIIDLYFSRSEEAISQTDIKYGRYCRYIAYNILQNDEDSEECVNDTYLRAWNSIPPKRPAKLQSYLGRITRNLSLNKYEKRKASKRSDGELPLILDELSECIGDTQKDIASELLLRDLLNTFLYSLDTISRKVFVRRYWYASSLSDIAKEYKMTENNVSVMLHRIRKKLREALESEGITI